MVYCLQRRKEQTRSSQDIRYVSLSLPPGFPSREASQRDDGKRPGQPPSPWPCDPPRSQGRPKRDSDHAYRVCLPLLGSPHPHVGFRPIASLSLGACTPMQAPVPLLPSPWAPVAWLGPVPVWGTKKDPAGLKFGEVSWLWFCSVACEGGFRLRFRAACLRRGS